MRGYVGPEGAQIHYRASGVQGPAVVLFHESPQASNVFAPAMPALGRSLRAYAFDTPGYGLSDPPPHPLDIPGYARLLLRAIDTLGIETFAVVGQHTGASLALAVAHLAAPGRVTHAVLSGLVLDRAEREELGASWAPDRPIDPDGGHLRDLWTRYAQLWERPPELVNLAVANIASVFDRYNWSYRAAFGYDPVEPLRTLPCPVLLLTAERDMLAHCDALALTIRPDAKAVRLTDTTGQLPWRVPEEFASVLASFVTGPEPATRRPSPTEEGRRG
ncbi:alpha/beta fold hydrolase [Micromonospora wenchangensis]|uniref:alpha/beta fold hydrolase n=1 Tax=Micromonospora wenchangensis TaxID=1185415 RepID=UPI003D712C78